MSKESKIFGLEDRLIDCKRSRNAEIRNWKFGLHAFVPLMNAFNDLVSSNEPLECRARPNLITLLPVCKHPTRKLVSSLPNFYFPISSFKP